MDTGFDCRPLVTFLSPCYNHAAYVIQSLESIRAQNYPNLQHVIIDDASTDGSADLIERWIADTGHRCEFIRHSRNKGISSTLNEGIEMCQGELWTALATDDFITENRTQKFVDFLLNRPEVGMVVSDSLMVNEVGQPVIVNGTSSFLQCATATHPNFSLNSFGRYDSLLYGNYVPGSMMFRKSLLQRLGGFNVDLKIEDWDMWLRIASIAEIGFLNEKLTYYRRHASNSVNQSHLIHRDVIRVLVRQEAHCRATHQEALFRSAFRFHANYLFSFRTAGKFGAFLREAGPKLFLRGLWLKAMNFLPTRKHSR